MSKPGGRAGLTVEGMAEDLYYTLDRPKLGIAVIINNLHSEQVGGAGSDVTWRFRAGGT